MGDKGREEGGEGGEGGTSWWREEGWGKGREGRGDGEGECVKKEKQRKGREEGGEGLHGGGGGEG